jgi:hypothetical protein
LATVGYTTPAAVAADRPHIVLVMADDLSGQKVALYDLETDPTETKDLAAEKPELFARMRAALLAWNASVEASVAGRDYPEGKVVPADPERTFWNATPAYQPYLEAWGKRPEYETFLKNRGAQSDAPAPKTKKKAQRKSG